MVICIVKPLARPIIGEYCVIGLFIALHMSGSKDADHYFRFYGLMAECERVALHNNTHSVNIG